MNAIGLARILVQLAAPTAMIGEAILEVSRVLATAPQHVDSVAPAADKYRTRGPLPHGMTRETFNREAPKYGARKDGRDWVIGCREFDSKRRLASEASVAMRRAKLAAKKSPSPPTAAEAPNDDVTAIAMIAAAELRATRRGAERRARAT